MTVLVCGCDLFEPEAYLEGLDAKDLARVLRAFQQACEEAAHRFDGTVVQCNAQGLLVCFGFLAAYEDGARRAARIGLGILADMKVLAERFRHEHKLEVKAYGGIHPGGPLWRRRRTRFRWWRKCGQHERAEGKRLRVECLQRKKDDRQRSELVGQQTAQ